MTTGIDLVREQILIASGEPLRFTQDRIRQTGHSLECRIYAEVPEENFRPDTGTISVFEPPAGPGVRLDSGVALGSVVGHQFDPQLAKLIVWTQNRPESIARMKRALHDFVLLGVRNNIEFLGRVISAADFRSGKLDTSFLDRHPDLFAPPAEVPKEAALVASLATGGARRSGQTSFADAWQSGAWRNT
jgi:acetyl/propionyl-CoA carboxylase alpha subunit